MSVQVSYKKQIFFGIIMLAIILGTVEIFVNIWWYYFYTCEFEEDELFENLDEKSRKQLCLENLEIQQIETRLKPFQGQFLSINSHGFRGPEISIEKPANTYRIFVVGGSTTFGTGVSDIETTPFLLQKKFDDTGLDFHVQVINAGIPGIGSEVELQLIKSRLVNYNPDLVIVYDGVNEVWQNVDVITWKDSIIEICKMGKIFDFDTIAILQPFLGTADRPLTEHESRVYQKSPPSLDDWLKRYATFAEQLPELNSHCIKTADMRGIFENPLDTDFWDWSHVRKKGNQVIAENMYNLSLPTVLENADKIMESVNDDSAQIQSNQHSTKSIGILENTSDMFEKIMLSYKTPRAILYFMSFDNRFTVKDIPLDNKQVTELDEDLVGVNLIGANLTGKDLSGRNLENVVFFGADLRNTNFANSNLQGADFRKSAMEGIILEGANLQGANLSDTDLSWLNLSNINLVDANLDHAKLVGVNLTKADLEGAMLSHSDFSVAILLNANLNGAILSYSDFSVANLQNTNLVNAIIEEAVMHAANLMNANLTNAKIIKTDLYGANLQGAIMEGANLTDSNLTCINNPICI